MGYVVFILFHHFHFVVVQTNVLGRILGHPVILERLWLFYFLVLEVPTLRDENLCL